MSMNKVIECEKELSKCPYCKSELAYKASHDNVDFYMYCKSNKCNFIGIVKDVYKDENDYEL